MAIQDTRNIALDTPLGTDKLLLQQMTVREELGRPYELKIIALSEDHNIALNKMLGEAVNVRLDAHGGKPRHFHGYVSSFALMTATEDFAHYEIIARPWLWFLTRNSDCRIFQEMAVPDIIKQVFRDRGFSDFEDKLNGSYHTWEYCVQYRETDFNFVSRLMEQEGIYYYFKHEEKNHTLVLSDSYSAHGTVSDYAEVPYFPQVDQQRRERDHVFDWRVTQQVQSGKYAIDDYDFKKPTNDLLVKKELARDHAHSNYEIYDYPGEYVEKADGTEFVRIRIEELQAQHEVAQCAGNARGLATGSLFNLVNYPRNDINKEYLIVSAIYELFSDDYRPGGSGAEEPFRIDFQVIDAKEPFRTARITPKPMVQGPQTAVVVGKGGEEIWCDEFGRVKVQFHWDRYGKSDENSSCWVRVAQVWAGVKWGAMHIPRMGQEVIVDFLEGDPDRPIITGRVYNGDNMPPYGLPANQTRSGIKSRSTKGGGEAHFNEIRFEDKKGEEEMYIHAEKDQNTVVENDQTDLVQHNKNLRVDNDRMESIGNDRTLEVTRDKTETIGRDKSITVGAAHSESVGANMTINVGASLTETVAINYAETVGAAMELTVGAALAMTVGASMQVSVGGIKDETIGAGSTLKVGKDYKQDVGAKKIVSIAKDYEEKIDGLHKQTVKKECAITAKKIQLVAKDELSIKVGSAQLTMKKNGDISVKGKKINVKGSGDVKIKGSKIAEN